MLRTVLLWFLRAVIALGTLVIALQISILIHPPAVGLVMGAAGRLTPVCTIPDAYSGLKARLAYNQAVDQMAGMKLQQRDGDYELWAISNQQWWVPAGRNSEHLAKLFGQQQQDVYGGEDLTGQVVLDCGAHIGLFVRQALRRGAKHVVAIEPSPANLECLRRNLADDIAAARVTVYAKGVWDDEKVLTFYENPVNSAGSTFVVGSPSATRIERVPVTTIDNLVRDLRLPSVDLVKMDIKGATLRALVGARQTLQKRPRVVISTEEDEDDPIAITSHLSEIGYRVKCGWCSIGDDQQIRPDVLFFQ